MRKPLFLTIAVLTCLLLLISFSFNTGIFAATTGKVQGTVIDTESKEPLPGVNVMIEGTTFGAATDENGYYFIINVPPGTYSLKTSMVGYSTETTSDVRVYVDRTTTADVSLQSSAVVGEEVTVTAERVPVPLDVSSTEAYVSGEEIVEGAVGRFDELIGFQAGVEFANTTRTQRSKGFSVRGGDVDETDVQIDGMSLLNKQTRGVAVPISRNLIQDVQILTGGFNAEYGNVRSGLINVVTKDGSYNRYSGVLEGRYRAKQWKHFGPSKWDQDTETGAEYAQLFWSEATRYVGVPKSETYHWLERPDKNFAYWMEWKGWDNYAKNRPHSAEFYYEMARWRHRPHEVVQTPDLMMDVVGGGPIPFLSNTKFFISAFWNRSEYLDMAPMPRSHENNLSIKITKRIKSNLVLSLSGFTTYAKGIDVMPTSAFHQQTSSEGWYRDSFSHNMILADDRNMFSQLITWNDPKRFFNNQCAFQDEQVYTFGTKITHTLSPRTYYELNLSAFVFDSDKWRLRLIDPTLIHFIYDSQTGLEYGFDEFPRAWGRCNSNEQPVPYVPQYPDGEDPNADQPNAGPHLFIMRAGGKNKMDNVMGDYQIRGNFVSQINKYNQIKTGFQLARSYIRQIIAFPGNSRRERPITDNPSQYDKYRAYPWQLEWFIQDKLEWEGMILNAGVRALTFWPNTNGFDLNDETMFGYDEDGNPYWRYQDQWGEFGGDPKYIEGEGNWMWQNFRTRKTKAKVILQPRFGISHPITESSKIFFNYGHFYSQPPAEYLYGVSAMGASSARGGGQGNLAIPDLGWPKVIAYEIGYSQSIYNQILLQISGYYKDYTDEIVTTNFNSYFGDNDMRIFNNYAYKDIRGLEFRLERSFGRFFNGWANYNYMITSKGATGFQFIYEDPLKAQAQYYSMGQSKPETRPSARINFSLRTPVGWGPGSPLPLLGIKPLAEWRINLLYTWQSGGEQLMNSSAPPSEWIYVDRVSRRMSNLYISKRLSRGLQFYCQVQNVFNNKRLRSTGGSYRDSLHMWWEEGPQHGNDKIGEYDQEKKPWIFLEQFPWRTFYPEIRMWYFGLRYQF